MADADGIGQGDEILLAKVGNVIVGYTGSVPATTDAANVYFTIAVNNDPTDVTNDANGVFGDVTFTQVKNVWHANTGSDDDTSSLSVDGVRASTSASSRP